MCWKNLILFSISLYLMLRETEGTLFESDESEEDPRDELDRLLQDQIQSDPKINRDLLFSRYRRNTKMRLCGRKLVDTLNVVCNGCTAPIPSNKVDDSFEFRRKRDVHHESHHGRRPKRAGIATECCAKMCTMETLRSHCSPC